MPGDGWPAFSCSASSLLATETCAIVTLQLVVKGHQCATVVEAFRAWVVVYGGVDRVNDVGNQTKSRARKTMRDRCSYPRPVQWTVEAATEEGRLQIVGNVGQARLCAVATGVAIMERMARRKHRDRREVYGG